MRFEWDPVKNAKNQRKHRIDFREAKTVFQDDKAIKIEDDGDVIRIFSARKATESEKELYERGGL